MDVVRSQISKSGVYAYSSTVPADVVAVALRSKGWVERATIWGVATAFIAVLMAFFIAIAPSEERWKIQLLAVIAAVMMVRIAFRFFAWPLFVRTQLLHNRQAIFLPHGNIATHIYVEQAARLRYVPDPARAAQLNDMLVEKSKEILRMNFLIGQLIRNGEMPGSEKYEAASDALTRLESEIAGMIDAFVAGEPE